MPKNKKQMPPRGTYCRRFCHARAVPTRNKACRPGKKGKFFAKFSCKFTSFELLPKKFKIFLDKIKTILYNDKAVSTASLYGGVTQLVEYPVHTRSVTCSSQVAATRPVGQAVKTPPFHGGNMGSIPVRVTKKKTHTYRCVSFFIALRESNPSKCNSPVDCCPPSAGRRRLLFDDRFPYGSPSDSLPNSTAAPF